MASATIHALGDAALLVRFPEEQAVRAFLTRMHQQKPPWLDDIVPAYQSVGLYWQPGVIESIVAQEWVRERLDVDPADTISETPKHHCIPVHYENAPDRERVQQYTGLAWSEIVALHTSAPFVVYAVGFAPGFAYLGYLPMPLAQVPRHPSPRSCVPAGSVAITGKQTAVYPLDRPGGWNIIGACPLTLVDLATEYFPMAVGDTVRFVAIDAATYEQLLGQRLNCVS